MAGFSCYNNGPSLQDIFAESIYPLDSRIILVQLNKEEHNRWMEFQELVKGEECHTLIGDTSVRSFKSKRLLIELDHPFVPVVSDFAVAAFNELWRMYVKKGEEENMYKAEVINVICECVFFGYLFDIKFEAMEENVAGVYEATVLCYYDDGRQSLIKFVRLSPRDGNKRSLANKRSSAGLQKRKKAVEGVSSKLDRHLKRTNWQIKRNQDEWFVPNKISGLQPRSHKHHPCMGYDYRTTLKAFAYHLKMPRFT